MVHNVTDASSNTPDKIHNAAKAIGRSKDRRSVFEAIYRGKKAIKTVSELEKTTKLSKVRVLQVGKDLANNALVEPIKVKGETGYRKDGFYYQHRKKILSMAGNKPKLDRFPTKTQPRGTGTIQRYYFTSKQFDVTQITVDDIDSFAKVRGITGHGAGTNSMLEKKFKAGIKKIIGATDSFKDWGGEINDLCTTRLKIKGRRITSAFAFKGRGTQGKLRPKDMGKNGDQIQRLFKSTASVFLVQYAGEIDESVQTQMKDLAVAKSVYERQKIYYGVIDGQDTARLIAAYSGYFK
jgi:hypothetical protein